MPLTERTQSGCCPSLAASASRTAGARHLPGQQRPSAAERHTPACVLALSRGSRRAGAHVLVHTDMFPTAHRGTACSVSCVLLLIRPRSPDVSLFLMPSKASALSWASHTSQFRSLCCIWVTNSEISGDKYKWKTEKPGQCAHLGKRSSVAKEDCQVLCASAINACKAFPRHS